MPDHIHLIIQPHRARYNITEVMRYIKGDFGRNYNNLIRKNGTIWQRRFYDTILMTEEALSIRINYILQNPVRANIIEEATDYAFSSAKAYLSGIDDHITDKYISK